MVTRMLPYPLRYRPKSPSDAVRSTNTEARLTGRAETDKDQWRVVADSFGCVCWTKRYAIIDRRRWSGTSITTDTARVDDHRGKQAH